VSNLDTILAFLQGKGLTPAQAAGVAGNLQVESGFNPAAYNAGEGAIGIAQWENGRRTALDNFAARTGGSETDLGTQLNFLWQELTGSESGALAQLQQAGDAASAASAFDQYYERSSGGSRSTRIADAQKIAGGDLSAGAGTSSSGGGSGGSGGSGKSIADSMGSGLFGTGLLNWGPTAFTIGVKVLAAAAAAGLVIVGATRTVSSR
jgi:hypothetical protein